MIFVDHFTHYVWLYPLRRKSDVLLTFTRFKNLVKNKFNHRIITFYSDNGGEYTAMRNCLAENGITHLTSPPHTPEHNGFAERRHRHLVETGLALLSHASLPLIYWSYALAAASYLINRLPTSTLSNSSSFECLNGSPPNYTKLRVFGCLCYPWLRPYTKHKLEPRSKPCIFLGYSQTQSAYLCLEPSSKRIFISRHVLFHETTFPHKNLTPPSPLVSSSATLWFPPLLQVAGHSNSPSQAVESPLGSDPSPTPVPAITVAATMEQVTSPDVDTTSSPYVPPTAPVTTTATNKHPMVTRSKNQITKPSKKFAMLTATALETEPTSVAQAL